jgi:uncharacterized protein YutE (UPF0331/DUF86 family)
VTASAVRLKLVRERLAAVAGYVAALRALPQETETVFLADRRNPDSAESLIRRALEALFDVARHLLAKGMGKGALEYKEVARLAIEHGLLADAELGRRLQEMAGFRNRLTHFYDEVTPQELYAIVRDELGDLEAVADALRQAASRLAARHPEAGAAGAADQT